MNSPFCKACGKPVEWHPTASGSSMPIDPDPHPEGTFGFVAGMKLARLGLGAKKPRMYRCHWDTCAKGAKPERPAACDRDGCARTDRHLHCFRCGSTDHLASECDGDE